MSTADKAAPPVVCTLTLGKRTAQQLEWADLAPLALSRTEVDGGVASTYPLALADEIEELAAREVACCGSWLDIVHQRGESDFQLRLTTSNPDGAAMIRSLSGLVPG